MRVRSVWPASAVALTAALRRVQARLASVGGRVVVDLSFAAEPTGADPGDGTALEASAARGFAALARGETEAVFLASDLWRGRHPGFAAFSGLPMGLTPAEHSAWLDAGGGRALMDDLAASFGLSLLPLGQAGPRPTGLARGPITEGAAMAGTPVAMAGLGGRVLEALGARPAAHASAQLSDAFGPAPSPRLWLSEGYRTVVVPGFQAPGRLFCLAVSARWLSALDTAERRLIAAAVGAEGGRTEAAMARATADALAALVGNGARVAPWGAEDWARLAQVSEAVIDDALATGPVADRRSRRILADWRAFRRRVAGWSSLAEAGFLAARAARAPA